MGSAEFTIIMERLDRLEELITGAMQPAPKESAVVITSFRERVKDSLAQHALNNARKSRRKKA